MTSLDMAGISLSLCYLDGELENLWRDPADSVAFARGRVEQDGIVFAATAEAKTEAKMFAVGAPISQADASRIVAAASDVMSAIEKEKTHLGDIDAIAGDGDHGVGMSTGIRAAYSGAAAAASAGAGAKSTLEAAGRQWAAVAGGTSGVLWGAGLVAAAAELGDDHAVDGSVLRSAVDAFVRTIRELGHAELGDKTMMDAIVPFAAELSKRIGNGDTASNAWLKAARAAENAALETANIAARRGRSRTHGDRSIGTADPGALSFAVVVNAVKPQRIEKKG
jgi:dihydroxyacetone kinase